LQIDPIVSLAMNVQSNRGLYALLLGSGLSRAAGIPTGEEVVLDLIRKIALLAEEDCEPNPRAWYASKYGTQADYSTLITSLSRTPAERSQLLKPYFEPTAAEISDGRKVPTAAHKAIAQLISKGYVRIIVTTNFDRLVEKAIVEVGIEPTVISSPDAAQGALPLSQSQCVVLKVNGDYMDTRIKNSPAELAEYDPSINRILDQVFDEYGLIICGWSSEYDLALRKAIERCSTRRFSTYWALRGEPAEAVSKLLTLRSAVKTTIRDADSFFGSLVEKVATLEDLSQPHPLSSKMAIATLKRYLLDDRQQITLHDMVLREAENAHAQLSENDFPLNDGITPTPELAKMRFSKYESITETLRGLFAAGAFWGSDKHEHVWLRCFEMFIDAPVRGGFAVWQQLRLYPALLLLYSAGISSVARRNYRTIGTLLTQAKFTPSGRTDTTSIAFGINIYTVVTDPNAKYLLGTRSNTALSDHLYRILRELFTEYLPRDAEFQYQFDKFEYLIALVCADGAPIERRPLWGPISRFATRNPGIGADVEAEIKKAGEQGNLLCSLFRGLMPRFLEVKSAIDALTVTARAEWGFFEY
jgi:hypothetical protein